MGALSRLSRWRLRARRARPVALAVAAVLAIVAGLGAAGLTGAIDASARRTYYDVRGPRPPVARVLFVAIDEDTARAWGPPPWGWDRYEALTDAILAGEPRLVALLEPGPRVAPATAPPPRLAAAIAAGRVVVPPPTPGFGQPAVALDTTGVVEAIELGDPDALRGATITAEVIRRLGLAPTRGRLAVNYVGPPDALPTLPAHHVARGDLPPATFTGRVVIIGVRGEGFTPLVPTPVGGMSPGEVHAHALHGLVERVAWRAAPAWLTFALSLACALGAVLGVRRGAAAWATALALAAVAAALGVAGYLAFTRAAVALGVGAPVTALALGAVAGLLLERRDARVAAIELARTLARRAGAEPRWEDRAAAHHERFVDALRACLDVDSAVWAELPPGAFHVELAGWWGVTAADVREQRRDVRRDPWRVPAASLRPEWANRVFLRDDARRTLIVPLDTYGRLHGFWLVNVRADVTVTPAQLRLVAVMANQLALERDRLTERPAAPGAHAGDDALASAVVDVVRAARHDAHRLGQVQDRQRAVIEHLPVGVLSATLWGEIEHANAAMRRFLAAAGVDDPRPLGLVDVLVRVTGVPAAAARAVVRELAADGAAVRLETRLDDGPGPGRVVTLVLDRVRQPLDAGEADELAPTSLVLTASDRPARDLAALDWRWAAASAGAGARHVVDVGLLVREAAAELAAAGAAAGPPTVELRAGSTVVITRGDEVAEAVRAILGESLQGGPAGARLVVEDDADVVTIRIVVPATLPASDVAALRGASPGEAPAHLAALVRARELLARSDGRLEIDSDLEHGTRVAIRLPKPGQG